jgi:hypothetical protein
MEVYWQGSRCSQRQPLLHGSYSGFDAGRGGVAAQWERAHEVVLELVVAADFEDGADRDTPRASAATMDLLRRLQAECYCTGTRRCGDALLLLVLGDA